MGIQTYGLTPERIGESLGRIQSHAMPEIVLGTVGIKDKRKKNTGGTTKYRRWLPKGATAAQQNRFFQDGAGDRTQAYVNAQLSSDGVTPIAETIVPQDITVEQKEFSVLYGFTNRTEDLDEDPIPKIMEELTGERTGLICEMQLYGVLKGCTNKYYGGTGNSRATVNGAISLNLLRRMARTLRGNHAKPIRNMLQAVPAQGKYNTAPIGGYCYPVFMSTDLCPDVRDLPNFVPCEEYGDPSKKVANEIGACEEFRFIVSPELVEVQDSGAAVAGTVPTLKSTSGTNADVYQVVVGGQDAWGHLGLELDSKNITVVPTSARDKSDPHGQRGYVGSIFYYNAVRLNDGWMAVAEVGTNALSG